VAVAATATVIVAVAAVVLVAVIAAAGTATELPTDITLCFPTAPGSGSRFLYLGVWKNLTTGGTKRNFCPS
jgi:hypothetical protein